MRTPMSSSNLHLWKFGEDFPSASEFFKRKITEREWNISGSLILKCSRMDINTILKPVIIGSLRKSKGRKYKYPATSEKQKKNKSTYCVQIDCFYL